MPYVRWMGADEENRKQLLAIRAGALDPGASITTLLRQCLALATDTGSEKLKAWAKAELKGYPDDADLPAYRKVNAALYADTRTPTEIMRHRRFDPDAVPQEVRGILREEVPLFQDVATLIAAAAGAQGGAVKFSPPGANKVMAAMYSESFEVTQIYWEVLCASLDGVADQVRTVLVEMTNEVLEQVPEGQGPTAGEVDRAVQFVVEGDKNVINVVTGDQSSAVGDSGERTSQASSSGVRDFFTGTAAQVVGALLVLLLVAGGTALGLNSCESDGTDPSASTTTTTTQIPGGG